jgi:hypothetical protein
VRDSWDSRAGLASGTLARRFHARNVQGLLCWLLSLSARPRAARPSHPWPTPWGALSIDYGRSENQVSGLPVSLMTWLPNLQSISNQLTKPPPFIRSRLSFTHRLEIGPVDFKPRGSTPSASRTTLAVAWRTVSSCFERGSPATCLAGGYVYSLTVGDPFDPLHFWLAPEGCLC